MSSVNEHLLPPAKPKLSPLELRNTDLVSRLLAATPPYLYNMALLPNTYFFSEMLRSFVQAKNEQRGNIAGAIGGGVANLGNVGNMHFHHPMRRNRKRGWNRSFGEGVGLSESKMEKLGEKVESSEPWMIKSSRKNEDSPLELTSNVENCSRKIEEDAKSKIEERQAQYLHPGESSSNLVLPPPPPMWYPPIYPTPPYGIDPLHFFIDLRVSGHIYDRQNNNQSKVEGQNGPAGTSTIVGPREEEPLGESGEKEVKIEDNKDMFRQKRQSSAFSVPVPGNQGAYGEKSQKRFDVKSMGFDKSFNKTSTNYVLSNITPIYKRIGENKSSSSEDIEANGSSSCSSNRNLDSSSSTKDTNTEEKERDDGLDSAEEREKKRVKDLRALIGLELVVDYMSHKKPEQVLREEGGDSMSEEGMSSDIESLGSPTLEVVAVQDDM